MDPLTILALGSTALTAIGKLGAGFAGSQLDLIKAGVDQQNTQLLLKKAQVERDSAGLSLAQDAIEQARTADQVRRVIGGETAGYAASNLDPTSGSPALMAGFSASQGAIDAKIIGARAQLGVAQAYGAAAGTEAEAASSNWQAIQAQMKSTQDVVAGFFGAGTALLQGVGNKNIWQGALGPGSGG